MFPWKREPGFVWRYKWTSCSLPLPTLCTEVLWTNKKNSSWMSSSRCPSLGCGSPLWSFQSLETRRMLKRFILRSQGFQKTLWMAASRSSEDSTPSWLPVRLSSTLTWRVEIVLSLSRGSPCLRTRLWLFGLWIRRCWWRCRKFWTKNRKKEMQSPQYSRRYFELDRTGICRGAQCPHYMVRSTTRGGM